MAQSPLQVVIIDDSPEDRALMRRALLTGSERRFVFHEADKGEPGLELCHQLKSPPAAIVLLDLNLPGMNGLEVLETLKDGASIVPLPVVVLTGGVTDREAEEALAMGAQDFIAKSQLGPELLSRVVSNALARFALLQKLQAEVLERKQAQQQVQFQANVLAQVKDAVIVIDNGQRVTYLNPAAAEQYQVNPSVTIGQSLSCLYQSFWLNPDDEAVAATALDQQGYWQGQNLHLKQDGRQIYVESSVNVLKNETGQAIGLLAVVRDITERKQVEAEREQLTEQLRQLTGHLQTAREEERTYIAREIHDELGQALTALNMDLSWLANQLPRNRPVWLDKIEAMSNLVGSMVQQVQRIATELRPGLLDKLGLVAAIEWQAQEFASRTGINCELRLRDPELPLAPNLATTLFRIVQEALTNIARHAEATWVEIELANQSDYLTLTVRDNGRGIDPARVVDLRSLGLTGMRERARNWDGHVLIEGAPGQGTTVVVQIPRLSVQTGDTAMIRVLVVDDHAVVRQGVVQIMSQAPDMVCTGEAASGREALRLALQNDYEVVVLDINLPDGSGLDILKQLRLLKPELPVLMLTVYPEQQFATRAFKAGAAGYLTKDSIPRELLTAIYKIAGGGRYVSQVLAESLVAQLGSTPVAQPHELLSDREDQVMRLLAAGKTVTQIAQELTLGVKTVSTYRTRVLKKLGLKTNAELIRYALQQGLAE
ncbi:MAG: response regulator [Anaerolineales bacterium]|nr:response regulator [Anaerolineales bacterium]